MIIRRSFRICLLVFCMTSILLQYSLSEIFCLKLPDILVNLGKISISRNKFDRKSPLSSPYLDPSFLLYCWSSLNIIVGLTWTTFCPFFDWGPVWSFWLSFIFNMNISISLYIFSCLLNTFTVFQLSFSLNSTFYFTFDLIMHTYPNTSGLLFSKSYCTLYFM